jgi:hypothetical protein
MVSLPPLRRRFESSAGGGHRPSSESSHFYACPCPVSSASPELRWSSLADALPPFSSLADTLPLFSSSGCFAAVIVLVVDRFGGCFATAIGRLGGCFATFVML